ncbi:MAG: endo-1,4-beta-xylanase, partial [Alphaproteobacteria bacterium]|nr:endo-1,4-beta-xylanase [Alphaproteobacteria bacterium]
MKRRDFGRLCIATAANSFGLAAGAAAQPETIEPDTSLKRIGEKSGILFGLCEPGGRLGEERPYFDRLAVECSLLSPGNDFNWAAVQPSAPSEYRYASLDAAAAFCRAQRLGMIGHTLAWYYSVPAWAKVAEPNDFVAALGAYVTKTVQRYADVVKRWDVVNEPVHPRSPRPDGLRESPFLEKAGPNFIRDAFINARRAAPGSLLCLNEYGFEYDDPDQKKKRALFLGLIRTLREAGAPIDVIGLQSHLDASKRLDLSGLEAMLRDIKALGLRVAVTELDVNDQKLPGDP